MKIKKIHIKNFKKFKNLEVTFQDLDCLVGSNNSGKSTLLQAIALFDFCLHQCLSKVNGNPITLKNRSITEEEFVVLPITKGTDLWHDKTTQGNNKHILIEIAVTFDNDKTVLTKLDFSFNRFKIETTTEQNESWLMELQQFKAAYLPVFSTFRTQEEKRTSLAIRNDLAKGNVNAVIRNLLLALKEQNRAQMLIEIMQNAFPSIKKLSIEFDEASMQYIEVTYQEDDKKKSFDIFSAGSGFQQFLYLFGFILLENPSIILLDEPDVHLHGYLQKALLQELQNLAQAGQQVVFATHSRDLIASLQPENILSLHNGEANRLTLDYQVFNTLENLGSMENTQLIVMQEFKRILVVENKEDWDFIQVFGNIVLGEVKIQAIAKRLAVCYAYGNPYKQDMVKFQKSMQQMFIGAGEAIKMLVVCDRDYYPELEELQQELKEKSSHIHWHIWERNEIQNYLLSPTALGKIAMRKKQASVNLQQNLIHTFDELFFQSLSNAFQTCIESQKDDIQDRFVKTFEEYSRSKGKGWDSSTCSKKSREYLQTYWETHKTHLADAKKVISYMSKWLQDQKIPTFNALMLAEKLIKEDLPTEIFTFFDSLAQFVGVE
jgi:predicted ATPase